VLRRLLSRLRGKSSDIPRVPAPIPRFWAEVNALNLAHGDARIGAPYTDAGLPNGWAISVRRWDEQAFDALIFAPWPKTGWRLADPFACTSDDAYRRAREEIFNHARGAL